MALARTALYDAVEAGDVGDVEVALAMAGANMNTAPLSKLRRTPLYIAAYNGYWPVVDQLIAAGAALDQADVNGRTPLYAAAACEVMGREVVVERLLAAGAAVDQADKWGQTPLLGASRKGRKAVVELLLAAGATVDQAANDGRTPLSIAVWLTENNMADHGHCAVAHMLREPPALPVAVPAPEGASGGAGGGGGGARGCADEGADAAAAVAQAAPAAAVVIATAPVAPGGGSSSSEDDDEQPGS